MKDKRIEKKKEKKRATGMAPDTDNVAAAEDVVNAVVLGRVKVHTARLSAEERMSASFSFGSWEESNARTHRLSARIWIFILSARRS